MSGVRAAQALAERVNDPEDACEAMQDVLYEILAEGIDPELTETPIPAIEAFLHEHARTPKSADEFREFFRLHGIHERRPSSVDATSRHVLPPLELQPAVGLPAIAEPVPPGSEASVVDLDAEVALLRPARGPAMLWAALGVLSAVLIGVLWYGHTALGALRQDLRAAERESQAQARDLRELEQRSAGIQSGVAANGELIQRMDQKSDLMLESLLQPPPAPKRWKPRQ